MANLLSCRDASPLNSCGKSISIKKALSISIGKGLSLGLVSLGASDVVSWSYCACFTDLVYKQVTLHLFFSGSGRTCLSYCGLFG